MRRQLPCILKRIGGHGQTPENYSFLKEEAAATAPVVVVVVVVVVFVLVVVVVVVLVVVVVVDAVDVVVGGVGWCWWKSIATTASAMVRSTSFSEYWVRIPAWRVVVVNQAYSRLSTTHGHITDCKLDSVVYVGVCV